MTESVSKIITKNYKETLFFIGKCLTINHERHNLKIVEKTLQNNTIDWEAVVKMSTSHYVFPALYCNLKKANLLSYLPSDLVEFMQHITTLNRERNLSIVAEIKEINSLLVKNNITPIFLKGVSNILQDYYGDIAERMIADIDFVVSKKDYQKAIDLIENFGYSKVDKNKNHSPSFKHHPRLHKEGCVAPIEIHKEVLIEKFADEFGQDVIHDQCVSVKEFTVLSYENQLSLTILANQINDDGFYFKNLTLKTAYDTFLISKKTNTKKAFQKFNKLEFPLTCFIATCAQVFNTTDSLSYNTSPEIERYLERFNLYLVNDVKRKRDFKLIKLKLNLIRKNDLILKTIFNKEYRNWFINDCLIRLGLRKLSS